MDVIVEGITKTYGFQKAVDNISFKVNQGEIVGFLGPRRRQNHDNEDHHLLHAPNQVM